MPIRAQHAARAALIPFFVLAGSCGVTDPDFEGDGIVRFTDVEGGCWALDTGDQRLEPINLPDEFRLDGLAVVFEADARPDLESICQIGRIVELAFIQVAAGPGP
jgi:hypothetical protein